VNSAQLVIRPMTGADLQGVVQVHLAAFPGYFLSFLGPRFLWLFYEEAVLLGEVAVVAEAGETVVGFAVGSTSPGRFYKRLLQRRLVAFALAALPAVARKPKVAFRLLRALLMPRAARKAEGTATLASLCVHPSLQGTGLGKRLVHAFADESGARGADRLSLTTDKLDNDRTNRFYHSLGFRLEREIRTPEGRVLNEYECELSAFQARS
jgi:ribosomal protein S18 acetylase RimI-like enzyme